MLWLLLVSINIEHGRSFTDKRVMPRPTKKKKASEATHYRPSLMKKSKIYIFFENQEVKDIDYTKTD